MIIPGDDLPATYGTGAPQGNFGNLRTRGWELEADFSHRFDNGLRLSVNANISDATTVITKGADWQTPWENRNINNTFTTSKRYGDRSEERRVGKTWFSKSRYGGSRE